SFVALAGVHNRTRGKTRAGGQTHSDDCRRQPELYPGQHEISPRGKLRQGMRKNRYIPLRQLANLSFSAMRTEAQRIARRLEDVPVRRTISLASYLSRSARRNPVRGLPLSLSNGVSVVY